MERVPGKKMFFFNSFFLVGPPNRQISYVVHSQILSSPSGTKNKSESLSLFYRVGKTKGGPSVDRRREQQQQQQQQQQKQQQQWRRRQQQQQPWFDLSPDPIDGS